MLKRYNMQQPKSLTELARQVINQRVPTKQQLRDLTLPSSLLRYLEDTYTVNHHQLKHYKNPDNFILREMLKYQRRNATSFQIFTIGDSTYLCRRRFT